MKPLEKTAVMVPAQDKTMFGFWVYIMTDCVLFASIFATYAVLQGRATGHELFNLPFVLGETLILLTSSFICGLGILAAHARNKQRVLTWFGLTFLLGLAFLGMELSEFHKLVVEGHGWQQSGFLSAYFTLVGTHGLHIAFGLLWIGVLCIRIYSHGLTDQSVKRLTLLSLFWHFLDVIWIFIFTIVYLFGAL